jgi:hypothetical protein
MSIKVNERLCLIVPVYRDTGSDPVGYVHSTPLSRAAFDAHYRLIAATFASLQQQGIVEYAGPSIAASELRKIAADRKDDAGAQALLNEIYRLSVYVFQGVNGWEQMPFSQAAMPQVGLLDEDDVAEVTNGLTFFTVAYLGP